MIKEKSILIFRIFYVHIHSYISVDTEGKVKSDEEARSLLNRFLGAQVLMSGMESMMANHATSESTK